MISKKISLALWASVWLKNMGRGASPVSATELWCVLSVFHFCRGSKLKVTICHFVGNSCRILAILLPWKLRRVSREI